MSILNPNCYLCDSDRLVPPEVAAAYQLLAEERTPGMRELVEIRTCFWPGEKTERFLERLNKVG